MPNKVNNNKKSIFFKLVVCEIHQKTYALVSKFYNGEDDIDENKMKGTFKSAFNACLKQIKQNEIIDEKSVKKDQDVYDNELCSTNFIMQEYLDGPIEEFALSTDSFNHYIKQMIDNNGNI